MSATLLIAAALVVLYLGQRETVQRLRRLHSGLCADVDALGATLTRRRATLGELARAVELELNAAQAPVEQIGRAQRAVDDALERLAIDATDERARVALAEAEAGLAGGLAFLRGELDAEGDPRRAESVERLLAALDALRPRLALQARTFDASGALYESHRRRFPALWLARFARLPRFGGEGLARSAFANA